MSYHPPVVPHVAEPLFNRVFGALWRIFAFLRVLPTQKCEFLMFCLVPLAQLWPGGSLPCVHAGGTPVSPILHPLGLVQFCFLLLYAKYEKCELSHSVLGQIG